MRTRIKVGDVFDVPLGDGRSGIGQVAGKYRDHAYYFAIFDVIVPLEEVEDRVDEALRGRVLLFALSLDAKLHARHWSVVGHADVSDRIRFPAYKEAVGMPPRFDVVDHTGTRRKEASPAEIDSLPNRTVVAPVRLERALKAHAGLEPWLDAFDALRPSTAPTSAEIFD